MFKKLLPIMLLVLISLLVADIIDPAHSVLLGPLTRNTEGSMNFSVRTATYNGPYAPRNAGAIWVTNSQNQFVKTIKVWANQYRYTLVRWIASSNQNTTGATTGASLNNHQLHNVTWNGKNYQNVEVPDGEYKINVEFTEHNASASNMGKYKQVSFVKGPNPVNQTFPNETYFRDMQLTWTPVVVNGTLTGTVYGANNIPLAGATVQAGNFSVTSGASGGYSIVAPPGTYTMTCTAAGYHPMELYDVVLGSGALLVQDFHLDTVPNDDQLNPSAQLAMDPLYPNPFVFSTAAKVYDPQGKPFSMAVFNLRGQKVYGNVVQSSGKGWQQLVWNGQDDAGKRCPNGIYSIVISQDGQSVRRKVTLSY